MKFTESIILEDPTGLMNVRHLKLSGTNREIGSKLAEIAVQRHGLRARTFAAKPEHIKELRSYLSEHYPILLERAKGVADALAIDPRDDGYDFTGLPYNIEMPGCSSVFYPASVTESGHPTLSRNYDFCIVSVPEMLDMPVADPKPKPAMAEPYLLELHPTDSGYASLAMVCFDLLSGVLDGINSQGLCVAAHGNEVMIACQGLKQPESKIGIHELQSLRLVLDTCATVAEAKDALLVNRVYYELAPLLYLVADRQDNWMVFAPSFDDREPSILEGADLQSLTNHFPLVHSEKRSMMEVGTSSFQRWDMLAEKLSGKSTSNTTDDMKAVNSSVSVSQVIFWVPRERRAAVASEPGLARTLWHALYDLSDLSLNIKFYTGDGPLPDGGFEEKYSEYFQFALEE